MRVYVKKILPINLLLLAIGLTDLLTTLLWLHTGAAAEVNPIMATVLKGGLPLFIFVKLATLGSFVSVIEWYRRHRNAAFAKTVSNLTVLAYLGIYTVSFCSVNYKFFLG